MLQLAKNAVDFIFAGDGVKSELMKIFAFAANELDLWLQWVWGADCRGTSCSYVVSRKGWLPGNAGWTELVKILDSCEISTIYLMVAIC